MTKDTFHHGNLRQTLVGLAQDELEKNGYESLSLRELAKKVGVSVAAPYRHFKNREALLLELAQNGLDEIKNGYLQAKEKYPNEPQTILREACERYLAFAEAKPETYRLIFVTNANWHKSLTEDQSSTSSFGVFETILADAHDLKTPDESRRAAVSAWCSLHGLAMLKLNGLVDSFTDSALVQKDILSVILS